MSDCGELVEENLIKSEWLVSPVLLLLHSSLPLLFQTYVHACAHIHTHTYTHIHTCTHTLTHAHTHTHKHSHAHTHTLSHTNTHIHTHTNTPPLTHIYSGMGLAHVLQEVERQQHHSFLSQNFCFFPLFLDSFNTLLLLCCTLH